MSPFETKVCTKCAAKLPLDAFHRRKGSPDGRAGRCASCTSEYMKTWRRENLPHARAWARDYRLRNPASEERKQYLRDHQLRRKYGIGIEEYETLVAAADGRCEICGEERDLVVDHCHDSGDVRGVLCNPCNRGIGLLGDNPEVVSNAVRYLV